MFINLFKKNTKSGFTLFEMIISIMVILFMLTFVLANFRAVRYKGQIDIFIKQAVGAIATIRTKGVSGNLTIKPGTEDLDEPIKFYPSEGYAVKFDQDLPGQIATYGIHEGDLIGVVVLTDPTMSMISLCGLSGQIATLPVCDVSVGWEHQIISAEVVFSLSGDVVFNLKDLGGNDLSGFDYIGVVVEHQATGQRAHLYISLATGLVIGDLVEYETGYGTAMRIEGDSFQGALTTNQEILTVNDYSQFSVVENFRSARYKSQFDASIQQIANVLSRAQTKGVGGNLTIEPGTEGFNEPIKVYPSDGYAVRFDKSLPDQIDTYGIHEGDLAGIKILNDPTISSIASCGLSGPIATLPVCDSAAGWDNQVFSAEIVFNSSGDVVFNVKDQSGGDLSDFDYIGGVVEHQETGQRAYFYISLATGLVTEDFIEYQTGYGNVVKTENDSFQVASTTNQKILAVHDDGQFGVGH